MRLQDKIQRQTAVLRKESVVVPELAGTGHRG
jgi:hypothetical protein